MELLEINASNVDIILNQFDKEVDKEGYIVDKETGKRVICRYTNNQIKKEKLGGVLPGSSIFIEDSDVAYAGYIMEFLTGNESQ